MSLTACTECNREVSTKAETCPHCGAPLAKEEPKKVTLKEDVRQNQGCLWGCLGLVVFIAFLWAIGSAMPDSPAPSATSSKASGGSSQGRAEAWTYCTMEVKDRLVSPATADFPFVGVRHHTHHLEGSRYRVESHVDSQNRLGATTRTRFVCFVDVAKQEIEMIDLKER